MLFALSKWPPSPQGLPTLSIVQDPDTTQMKGFAQPIVFFRLDLNLSLLVHSPAASASLRSLRIRIPGRVVVPALTVAYVNPDAPVPMTEYKFTVPPIEFLDLSTCNVSESDIEALLIRFANLQHLVLDECTSLLRGGPGPAMGQELEWWSGLGRRCALAGVKKARDREKRLKAWLEAQSHPLNEEEDSNTQVASDVPRRARRGRRGLATATISLRGASSPPRAGPSIVAPPSTSEKKTTTGVRASVKIHIVPPLPTLLSICLHPTSRITTNPEVLPLIHAEFEAGWNDGIRVVWERRGRMGSTFLRGPTVGPKPRFLTFQTGLYGRADYDEGFEGLEDVGVGDEGVFFQPDGAASGVRSAPILCLGGSSLDDGHAEGCGHTIAQAILLERL